MVKTATIVCKRRRSDFTGSFVGRPYPASSKCMGMAADQSTCRGQMRYADSDTDINSGACPVLPVRREYTRLARGSYAICAVSNARPTGEDMYGTRATRRSEKHATRHDATRRSPRKGQGLPPFWSPTYLTLPGQTTRLDETT